MMVAETGTRVGIGVGTSTTDDPVTTGVVVEGKTVAAEAGSIMCKCTRDIPLYSELHKQL
jgi:hypothetical protein